MVALVDLRKAIDIAVRVRISIQCKCVLPLFSRGHFGQLVDDDFPRVEKPDFTFHFFRSHI